VSSRGFARFGFVNVAALVLRKAVHKKPAVALVGGYQRAKATTLPLPSPRSALFQYLFHASIVSVPLQSGMNEIPGLV